MPTYEYQCDACGLRFERRQAITAPSLEACPACGAGVRRLVSGGGGFIIRGSGDERAAPRERGCSLEQEGRTCCGREERCAEPPCEGHGGRGA